MAHVIARGYTQYTDNQTKVEFRPVLDRKNGAWVGHAETEADFSGRDGFERLSDAEFAALVSRGAEAESGADEGDGDGGGGDAGVVTPGNAEARLARERVARAVGRGGRAGAGGGSVLEGPGVDAAGNAVLTTSEGGVTTPGSALAGAGRAGGE